MSTGDWLVEVIARSDLAYLLWQIGPIDEASAATGEALPLMRRAKKYYVEEWAYLFWRRGQVDIATQLLGASDADRIRADVSLEENERRLIAEARAALEAQLPPQAFTRGLAAGAVLGEGELVALISEALSQPRANLDERRASRRGQAATGSLRHTK